MRGLFFKIFAHYARGRLYMVIEAQQVYIYPSMRVKTPENGKKRPFWGGIPENSRIGLPEIEKNGGGMPPPIWPNPT